MKNQIMNFRRSSLVLVLLILSSVFVGCSCLDKTPGDDLDPEGYADYIMTAFSNYWEVLKTKTNKPVDPTKWSSFNEIQSELSECNVNFKEEFFVNTIEKDAEWINFQPDREKYEEDNPGKTYKDQVVEIIAGNFKPTDD